MGNASSHAAAGASGSVLGAALLAILVAHFHMDPALASNWITLGAGVVIAPLIAYLTVKSKSDPALAAALAALNAGGDAPPTVEATPRQTVVTNPPPAPPVVSSAAVNPVPPTAPAADPVVPHIILPHGSIDAPSS